MGESLGESLLRELLSVLYLPILQATIRSGLAGDTATEYPSALLYLVILHSTICSAMPVDITTDYPLCFVC
jgi:hypothetical protein